MLCPESGRADRFLLPNFTKEVGDTPDATRGTKTTAGSKIFNTKAEFPKLRETLVPNARGALLALGLNHRLPVGA